jgi:hypothetical protein
MLQILIERALKVNRAFSADRCRILRLLGRCPRLGMKAAPTALTITSGAGSEPPLSPSLLPTNGPPLQLRSVENRIDFFA